MGLSMGINGGPSMARLNIAERRSFVGTQTMRVSGSMCMVANFNDARDAGSKEEREEPMRAFLEMLNSSQQRLHDYTDQCQLDAI